MTRTTPSTFASYISRHTSRSASAACSRSSAPPGAVDDRVELGDLGGHRGDRVGIGDVEGDRPPADLLGQLRQRSTRRAAAIVSKPRAASRRTVAAPIPLLAPVTRAIGDIYRGARI